jgi:methyl-accepting chemotaxis protein
MFSKLTLRTRIILGFVCIFVFALILGAVGIVSISTLQQRSSDMVFVEAAAKSAINVVSAHREWLQNLSNAVYTGSEFTGSVDPTTCAFGKWEQTDYAKVDNAEILSLVGQINAPHATIHHQAETIKNLLAGGNTAEAQAVYVSEIVPGMNTTLSLFSQINERYTEMSEAYEQNMNSAQTTLLVTEIVLVALSAVISVFLAIVIIKSVMIPIRKVTAVAERLSVGDLELECSYTTHDEIGRLSMAMEKMIAAMRQQASVMESLSSGDLTVSIDARSDADVTNIAIKHMLDNLNSIFSEIRSAADQVGSGSQQIADGAQGLASGATQQAASVQELSGSVTTVLESLKNSAAQARSAAELTGGIQAKASTGSEQMRLMVDAVHEISKASQKISEVVKAIDNIAFQTNILALNAAVEAARAGSAGKGFSVVAEEVRNLAGKSADAAKESAELIGNSMERAKEGVRIAEASSAAFQDIAAGIADSSRVSVEIAEHTDQQFAAVEEINTGLEQVSAVVQTNSATAEESAAASQELSGQSSLLRELVGKFKLNAVSELPSSTATRY